MVVVVVYLKKDVVAVVNHTDGCGDGVAVVVVMIVSTVVAWWW